ncbi:L,D-transpeptidase family protein [Xanthobacter sp. V4C-4]|uniref:L,D-transpeptidase family protein n=1 Tax=Xanthobacter cornucopiae TaxID=3119924 RepID=UPI00372847AD
MIGRLRHGTNDMRDSGKEKTMAVRAIRQTERAGGCARASKHQRARLLGVSAMSLALALSWGPLAWAEPSDPPQGMSPAAASARALLNGPRPAAPVTSNAGMGTADPPRAAPPVASGIDAAGNGEHAAAPQASPAATPPQAVARPIAPAASGPIPAAPSQQVAQPQVVQPQIAPASATPTDAAPQRAAVAPPAPSPAASSPVAPPPLAATPPAAGNTPASAAVTSPATAAPPAVAASPLPAQPDAAPAPAPAAVVAIPSGPLAPVAQALAVQIAQPDGLGATRKEAEALLAFYSARQGVPVFVDDHGVTARGAAVLARLAAAEEDGLDPADYAVVKPARGADATALAQTELRLAVAALTYARHAQAGRFDPSRISANVTPARTLPDPAAALATLAEAQNAGAALAAFNPPHLGYQTLKTKLAAMIRPQGPAQVAIAAGELLKPGDSDPRVPALRARLGLPATPGDLSYDPALVNAVKAFQDSVRLKPTGVLGAATVTALNRGVQATPSVEQKADIVANMERWRWLPRDLGAHYVWVNIPEFMARVHQGDTVIHETRVVVGKPETPTPLLSQDMRYAVVNPAWNIPPSIARNEMMPLLKSDPGALARRGIEVVRNSSGGYTFRQSPGERNALGRIKFMFPNDHAVYLHDTPSKALFARDQRAYSHGCMRVQDPLEFGEVLFNIGLPGENWTADRIGKLFGGKERYITLKQRIPVHVVYFTTFVNDSGRLETRDDLYGIHAEVKARLGLDASKRRVAEGAATARR